MEFKIVIGPPLLLKTKQKIKETKKNMGIVFQTMLIVILFGYSIL